MWTFNLIAYVSLGVVVAAAGAVGPSILFFCVAAISGYFLARQIDAESNDREPCQCADCRRARGEAPRTPVANIIPQARYEPAPQIEYRPPIIREVVEYRSAEPSPPPPSVVTDEMRERALERMKRDSPDVYYGAITREAEAKTRASRAKLIALRAERELEQEEERLRRKSPSVDSLYDLRDEMNADGEDTDAINRLLRRFE